MLLANTRTWKCVVLLNAAQTVLSFVLSMTAKQTPDGRKFSQCDGNWFSRTTIMGMMTFLEIQLLTLKAPGQDAEISCSSERRAVAIRLK
jgi:hypothetical protein